MQARFRFAIVAFGFGLLAMVGDVADGAVTLADIRDNVYKNEALYDNIEVCSVSAQMAQRLR